MAMAHPPVTHEQSVAPGSKPVASGPKRQFVPIRPAFRPLLPKPTPKESSPSNGIQIHTRAMLNSGRKRASASGKSDLQKRRKNYTIPPIATPKLARSEPVDIPASALSQKLGAAAAAGQHHSSGLPTPTSVNSSLADEMRRFERTESFSDSGRGGYATPLSSNGTLSPTDRYNSVPPSELSFKKPAELSNKSGTASPQLFEPLGPIISGGANTTSNTSAISISSAGFDDQAAPATPSSISESPTSVSTASIFGTREDSTPNGTVNPTIILGENDEFGLENPAASIAPASNSSQINSLGPSSIVASSLPENALKSSDFESVSLGSGLSLNATGGMSTLSQLGSLDEASLTPPSTHKNGGSSGVAATDASVNSAFSSLGMSDLGVFDDEFYFRADDDAYGAEAKGPTTNITSSGPLEPGTTTATPSAASTALAFEEPRGAEFSMDREDDFSFLDYLAPAPGESL